MPAETLKLEVGKWYMVESAFSIERSKCISITPEGNGIFRRFLLGLGVCYVNDNYPLVIAECKKPFILKRLLLGSL